MNTVIAERVRIRPCRAEGPKEDDHARQVRLAAQAANCGSDDAEILGDHRQTAQCARHRMEELVARPAPPLSVSCGGMCRRDRPATDEAAEVVDSREVDELEDPSEALDPPAVARRAVHRPLV